MAVQPLSFTGINRAVSDFGNAGSCEELINLRPTTQGLVPVSAFSVMMQDVDFEKMFVHRTGTGSRYIAVKKVPPSHAMQPPGMGIYLVSEDGTVLQTLDEIGGAGSVEWDKVHFADAGNYLLVSVNDEGNYMNRAYLWNGERYEVREADVPAVTFSIDDGWRTESALEYVSEINSSLGENELVGIVDGALSAVQEKNPDICFGYILVAVAFKTADGHTFHTGQWKVYDPTAKIGSATSPYVSPETDTELSPEYDGFFGEHDGHGYILNTQLSTIDRLLFYGSKLKVVFPALPADSWDESKSILRSVEVYASRPVPYIDTSTAYEGFKYVEDSVYTDGWRLIVAQRRYADAGLDGQILYHQASIQLSALASGQQEVELTFGGSIQMTGQTLQVDAGAVTRFGNVMSYNARFHYFDSVSRTGLSMPSFLFDPSETLRTEHVRVLFNDGNTERWCHLGTAELPEDAEAVRMVVADSLGVRMVETVHDERVTGMNYDYVWTIRRYSMDGSSSYNYSYHTGPCDTEEFWDETAPFSEETVTEVFSPEPRAINVTEQYNPFVFNVRNSYLAPGRVLDIQPQMVAVRDVSFGDYPLDVFTDRGTYALLQGDGTVLYSRFRAVSNLVSTSNGIPTESGTFFLAAGGLWLISGSKAVLISDALHLGPHKQIRTCDGFRKAAMGEAAGGYDVSGLLSAVRFKEYTEGATLSYNRYRDELMVSNRAYGYTYVLSLKYRQWFKIDGSYAQDNIGGDIATRPGTVSGKLDVLDLATELDSAEDGDVLVHIQSRPFSFGYRYSHVHRIVSMMRAVLGTEGVIVSLYGSDNLTDWKLLAFSFRAAVSVSQIRTTSASRSWRYYTVCIGGHVPSDTDFGPVLVDYEPVIRRIG